MSNVAVVYWSGTGNTAAMARKVTKGIVRAGGTADTMMARDFSPTKIDDYDAFAFGCPAMGKEQLEPKQFEPMYAEVEPLLTGKNVVLFGSYSWNHGEWMDIWKKRAEDAGLNVVGTLIVKDHPGIMHSGDCVRLGELIAKA